MAIRQIAVQRFSVTSFQPFEEVLAKIDAGVGHPDMRAFGKEVAAASTYPELEEVVNPVIGKSGLMEFTRFDLGQILRKDRGEKAPKIVRIVAGNPLIMKQMVEHVPDAGSYAPVTILSTSVRMGCTCPMTGWPAFSPPTAMRKPSKSRRTWTPRLKHCFWPPLVEGPGVGSARFKAW